MEQMIDYYRGTPDPALVELSRQLTRQSRESIPAHKTVGRSSASLETLKLPFIAK